MLRLNDTDRARFVAEINERLPAGARPAFTAATGHVLAPWNDQVTVVVVLMGVVAVVGPLLFNVLLLPGFLPVLWVVRQLRQPRLVAVTPDELLAYTRTFVRGSPKAFVDRVPLDALGPIEEAAPITVGTDHVVVRDHERAVLGHALQPPAPGSGDADPPAVVERTQTLTAVAVIIAGFLALVGIVHLATAGDGRPRCISGATGDHYSIGDNGEILFCPGS